MGYDTDPCHHKPGFSHGSFFTPPYKLLFQELKARQDTRVKILTIIRMTKSKRMFAEMLVQARGHGDADEIAKTMSLVDIIYEMKKEELKKATPEPEKESPPPSTEPVVEEKKAESFIEEEEPIVIMKIKDFWSRLTHDSDTD